MRRGNLLFFIIFSFLILLSLGAHLRIKATLVDDAYITYRYAANLSKGLGLVYNAGESVLGTTTPGYAIILAIAGRLFGMEQIPLISRWINFILLVAAGVSSGWAAFMTFKNRWLGLLIFSFFMISPDTLFAGVSGMEQPLFLALLSSGLLAFINGYYYLSVILIGLTPVVRPEGIFVCVLWAILLLINQRENLKQLRRTLTLLFLPGILWEIAAWTYYGSPIPQTIKAKLAGTYPIGFYGSFAQVLIHLGDGMFIKPGMFQGNLLGFGLETIIIFALLIIGSLILFRQNKIYWIIPALATIFVIFYALSKTIVFRHYYANFDVLLRICWLAGVFAVILEIIQKMENKWNLSATHQQNIASLLTATLVLFPMIQQYPWNSVWTAQINLREIDQSVLHGDEYRIVALQISPHLPNNTVVLMPEIGEPGFYLQNVMVLDPCGLVSPEALAYLPLPSKISPDPTLCVIPPQMVRDYHPDIVFTLEILGRNGILKDPWFLENYTPVIYRDGEWAPWNSKGLYIFSRNGFEPGISLKRLIIPDQLLFQPH